MNGKKETRDFHITVLGRTLEHLGVQMYKRRDTAIAELVANCWDAGATRVDINIPVAKLYDPATDQITITDDGSGMEPNEIQKQYLVVGRNRRRDEGNHSTARPVVGKKGIGKLAGFGIASKMTVTTWRNEQSTEFTMSIDQLKKEDGMTAEVPIKGIIGTLPGYAKSKTGTRITLDDLKHKSPIDIDKLRESLARRFSHRIRGEMRIVVSGDEVGEPSLNIDQRFPDEGYLAETLSDGTEVKYFYAFTKDTIKSAELRGFTIYVRGKTAQAPPFFFHVEGTASGQHATKYVTGAIEADFLDDGVTDESDIISTDRQEIDWESEKIQVFHAWGDALARRALRECANRQGKQLHDWILQDEGIRERVEQLDSTSQKQVSKFLLILGQAEPDNDQALELASSLVRAFEYRHFHDVINDIESVGENPEELQKLLSHLTEWKVLESRAILEIIRGRLDIIDKFHEMLVNDAPETASSRSRDNMHDLIAGYPWILHPEWQVLSEETRVSTQLKEWGYGDITDEDERLRYDFLALSDERRLVIVEIKRANYAVTLDDLQRLEKYKERLSKAQDKELIMVLICGGTIDVSPGTLASWEGRSDGKIMSWNQIYQKTHDYYEHYRAVLAGNVRHGDFFTKEREIDQTRKVLTTATVHRPPEERRRGLGPQDISYAAEPHPEPPPRPIPRAKKK